MHCQREWIFTLERQSGRLSWRSPWPKGPTSEIQRLPALEAMNEFVQISQTAVKAAGEILRNWYGKTEAREKGPADFVTEADFASQERIREILLTAFPDHKFLGEESEAAIFEGSGYCWVVDPLDGTSNYIHQIPHFCVSIGLLRESEPVCGTIFDPIREECFSAVAGGGTFLNGKALTTSDTTELRNAFVAASFPPRVTMPSKQVDDFLSVLCQCQTIRRSGSSALNLGYVAAGRYDAYWARHVKLWDVAAGILLVREAGGIVTGIDGGPFDPKSPAFIAAATSQLHQELLSITVSGQV